MKTFKPVAGPFRERPYYELEEIERICSSELQAVGLYPDGPQPIRIERFVERRFGVTPEYEDLAPGVLGWTKFGPKGVEAIVVARALSEEQSRVAERRINTTLAHEAGHGLLHAHLFVLGAETPSLFGRDGDVEPQRILCREESGVKTGTRPSYSGQWWEFQANQAMGALLLPKRLVGMALAEVLAPRGTLGERILPEDRREDAARLLTETFDVNPAVARIRVASLYPEIRLGQLTLYFFWLLC